MVLSNALWVDDLDISGGACRMSYGLRAATVPARSAYRGRGHAGSVTAALVERLFATGRTMVCLYTDLRNISSNRCYANIGFKPVCDAWHYVRCSDN
ncbi:MAG: GNAT family N-acetyltransferase [Alphaproteobacteria bacterium]